MATKPYASIVTSILLSSMKNGKHVKGFVKEYPTLPWYTGQQMEEIRREEQRIASNPKEEEEDPVLETLRQKDLKMKRTISQLFSDCHEEEIIESSPKRIRTEPTETRLSLSNDSDDMMTPTEAVLPIDSPKYEANVSGRYRLEIDSDTDQSENQVIFDESRETRAISQEAGEQETSQRSEERDSLTTDSLDASLDKTRDRAETSTATDCSTNSTALNSTFDSTASVALDSSTEPKAVLLSQEEVAEINRQRFMIHYESMCSVVGLSKQEGDALLKEWEEEESIVKPPGILKTPTERFGTNPDPTQPDTPTTTAERVVSFLIPESKESHPSHSTATAVESQSTLEPTTPTLLTPPLHSALMSTPILSSVSSQTVVPQDLSIIPPESIQTQHHSVPPLAPLSAAKQSVGESLYLSRLISNSSPIPALPTFSQYNLITSKLPLTIPIDTISTAKPNPLAFLQSLKPQTAETGSSIFKLHNVTTTPATSLSILSTFVKTSVPLVTPATPPLFQPHFSPLSAPCSLSASHTYLHSTPTPQTANSIQLKPNKPFHNLEISYSIPTAFTSKSLFNIPAPAQTSTVASAPVSIPVPSPFKPMGSLFQSQPKSSHSALLTHVPLLSSIPDLSKPAVDFQAKPTPSPVPSLFSFNPQQTTASLPSAPVFTPNIPVNFSFGQPTDTNNSAMFLGPAAGSSTNLPSNYRSSIRSQFKKKRK